MNNKKILVCDDDLGILEMLELILEDDYQVILVPNSVNALKKIESEWPDLILLDIWMPVISGDQILRELKAKQNTSTIPVLMYSASTDGMAIAESAGANGFIAKPFDIDELIAQVKQLINDSAAAAD